MRISSSPFKHIEGAYILLSILWPYTDILEASPTSAPTSKIPIASELGPREPYHVLRTPSNQLPIYLLAKRGGNLHQTRIKKVEGDLAVLRNQLQQALKVPEEEIRINQRTRHIVIKVRYGHTWYSSVIQDIDGGSISSLGRDTADLLCMLGLAETRGNKVSGGEAILTFSFE